MEFNFSTPAGNRSWWKGVHKVFAFRSGGWTICVKYRTILEDTHVGRQHKGSVALRAGLLPASIALAWVPPSSVWKQCCTSFMLLGWVVWLRWTLPVDMGRNATLLWTIRYYCYSRNLIYRFHISQPISDNYFTTADIWYYFAEISYLNLQISPHTDIQYLKKGDILLFFYICHPYWTGKYSSIPEKENNSKFLPL